MLSQVTKTILISTRIVICYLMKWGSHCEFDGKSTETETTTGPEFPNGVKAIVEQILASKETNPKEQEYENNSLGPE